jgi:predicted ArsR family transcriptional regulator
MYINLTVRKIERQTRGRPELFYELSGKARSLLNIAKNWGKRNYFLRQYTKPVTVEVAAFSLAA